MQLLAVEPGEIWDPHEHRRIVVEVRRREVDAAVVGDTDLLLLEVADAEHQHIVEAFAGVRIDGVGPLAAMEREGLAVHRVGRAAVVGQLAGRVRKRQRELVQVGHRRHGGSLPVHTKLIRG